jgi:MoaA/NifB/PqqE/SkfB family radical SAM enzyme
VQKQIPFKKPLFDNCYRVGRILYRLSAYRRLSCHMLRHGVSARDIVRSQFPYIAPDPSAPLIATVEFTNYCNLQCVYCLSPLGLRPRGFLQRETLFKIAEGVRQLGVRRVRVVGLGEPTLHPEFALFMQELARAAPYLSIVTNTNWKRPEETIRALLEAPVSLVEISADSANKEGYEKSRLGGDFERLLANLTLLKETKRALHSRTIVNIRLMARPSERAIEHDLIAFWRDYADTVMPQYVVERKRLPNAKDVYRPTQFEDESYPRCSLPFKDLTIHWNGDVPLCYHSAQQIGEPGLLLGNVQTHSLAEMWNADIMRQYREGHCARDASKMPMCKGCSGV